MAKIFSELKLVTDNLFSIHAAANWEATESLRYLSTCTYIVATK